ncbi:phasin [Methylopila sp. M107]|uniref:phasin n=1 Tax=Methylopila sp. M107 TaxID=1101190 RepID=UPI00037B8627|nr:phasin [Methylopila sp. M107]
MATTTKNAAAAKTDEFVTESFAAADKAVADAPAPVREFAEKSVKQAKDGYAKWKSVSEEATDALEDAYATASKGYKELGRKSVEATRSNLNAHFDFLQALIGAKSVTQAIELQSSYAQQQFEVVGVQVKELSTLAQKAVSEGAKPLQDLASKAASFAQPK